MYSLFKEKKANFGLKCPFKQTQINYILKNRKLPAQLKFIYKRLVLTYFNEQLGLLSIK